MRKQYGFESMNERSKVVDSAVQHAKYIRESIEELAKSKDRSVLKALAIANDESDSSTDESTDDDNQDAGDDQEESHQQSDIEVVQNNVPKLVEIVRSSFFNYFEIVERLRNCTPSNSLLELVKPELTQEENDQLLISHEAFCLDEELNANIRSRQVNVINGEIVTDSESDDADEICNVKTPLDDSMKALIEKKRKSIRRQASRLKAKRIAEQNFLRRKVSRKVRGIVKQFPDIGQTIEEFVKQNNVGADQWRRTGVLTFDGNVRDAKRVTYERIRQHLNSVYHREFSYGTTVQLCVARNKRRRSSRYRGLAQVTTRRARKGFQLRFNPDFHWSCALYRGLEYIQMSDGKSIININRDDAAGFRLDTLATNRQYSAPSVKGCDVLTTHTDYVNRYRSVLQTTSYNFTGTATTLEYCAGVVKASPLFSKSPSQHAADFDMLQKKEELKNVFLQPSGNPKNILCVRVDGASDEGPSHEEVQFFWARDHMLNERLATLVSTRSSGSSFLNRVELQNGCLTRGHSNLFIPSTLSGSCIVAVA